MRTGKGATHTPALFLFFLPFFTVFLKIGEFRLSDWIKRISQSKKQIPNIRFHCSYIHLKCACQETIIFIQYVWNIFGPNCIKIMIIHYQNEVSISKKTHLIYMEDYSVPIESSNKPNIQSIVLTQSITVSTRTITDSLSVIANTCKKIYQKSS